MPRSSAQTPIQVVDLTPIGDSDTEDEAVDDIVNSSTSHLRYSPALLRTVTDTGNFRPGSRRNARPEHIHFHLFSTESRAHWNELLDSCRQTFVGTSTNPFLGNGLFACESFKKGDFITLYEGLRMTFTDCDVLQRHGRPANYAIRIPKGVVIDALGYPFGAAMANHSCKPNTVLQHGYLRGSERAPYAFLEALCDISIGDELFAGYGYVDIFSDEGINHVLQHNNYIPCRCLQPTCRKVLAVLFN